MFALHTVGAGGVSYTSMQRSQAWNSAGKMFCALASALPPVLCGLPRPRRIRAKSTTKAGAANPTVSAPGESSVSATTWSTTQPQQFVSDTGSWAGAITVLAMCKVSRDIASLKGRLAEAEAKEAEAKEKQQSHWNEAVAGVAIVLVCRLVMKRQSR